MSKYQRQIARILKKWAVQPTATVEDLAKQARWPAGAPSSKGGQFAPAKGSGGGGNSKGGGSGASQFSSYGSLFGSGSKFPGGDSPAWAAEQNAKPVAPPPGAKPHLKPNDKGQTVTVNYPTKPSDKASWTDPSRTATFVPGGDAPATLNGVAVKSWASVPKSEQEWANVPGQKLSLDARFPFDPTPGKSTGAGVIIREPDGRIWLTKPTNAFGGYQQTFPKGTVEHGLSMQASAIKETWEETGLQVKITGILGDYERTTSKARFYVAERVGGTPADMGWESQAVRLANRKDLDKLLNMGVDKDILEDLDMEGFFDKAAGQKPPGNYNPNQPRWPAGTPLGGQWKTMDGDGVTLPPTIAGGLSGSNSQYQKKADAAYAAAKAGDKTLVLDTAITLQKKVAENAAKGASSSHVKWTAQLSQFVTQVASDIFAAPKVQAIADRLSSMTKLSSWTFKKPKSEGSNPGGHYTDSKGSEWLVKGNAAAPSTGPTVSDVRAKNEILASKLMLAAGAGAPEMRLVDLEGKHGGAKGQPGNLGVASKIVAGVQKADLSNPAHVAAMQKDFAVHAWLGNWDVLGQSMDNTMIGADGKAVCIDPGGSIFFRAQGSQKAAGQFGKDASDFETMRKTDHLQQKVFGSMTASQLAESASKLAGITDDTIKELVKTHGPISEIAQKGLSDILIARRDAILAKAGVQKEATLAGKPAAPAVVTPAPTPEPPKVKQANTPAQPVAGLEKPVFDDTFQKAAYYDGVAQKMLDAHAAGDMAALKALTITDKGKSVFATKKNGELTINGGLLKPFYEALEADLENQKATSAQALAAGKATLTGTDGKTWVDDGKGVLQPTVLTAGSVNLSSMKAITKDAAGMVVADFLGDKPIVDKLLGEPVHLRNLAQSGDAAGLVNFVPSSSHMKELQVKYATAMGADKATLDVIQNAKPLPDQVKASALTEDEFDQIVLKTWPKDAKVDGTYGQLLNYATSGHVGLILGVNVENANAYGTSQAIVQAMAAKAGLLNVQSSTPAAPALKPAKVKMSVIEDVVAQTFNGNATVTEFLSSNASGDKNIQSMIMAAATGDAAALQATSASSGYETKLKEGLVAAMAAAPQARASKSVLTTPQTVPQPAPKVPTGAPPNFDALKVTTGNASNIATFNNKLDTIKAAFEAGDENAILAMKFGINTPNKQAAKVANDALAALGSVHKVQAGQGANAHPALTGGTAQAPAAKPAAPAQPKPKAGLSDTSWVSLSGGEKIVEVKEEFGVKSALIEVPSKGYDPNAFSAPPDFFTNGSQGETGKWKSSKKEVNEANNAAVQQIYDAATKNGTPDKLKAMQFQLVEGGTVKMVGIDQHKATEVKEYFKSTLAELEAQLNPTYKTQTSGSMVGSYNSAARSIAANFAKKSYADFASHQTKAADYLVLSKDAGTSVPVPQKGQFQETGPGKANFDAFRAASKKAYAALTPAEQDAAFEYTKNAYKKWNYDLRTGNYEAIGSGGKALVAAFAKATQDIPEGTILWRGLDVGLETYKSVIGGLIQDGSFNSSSYGASPAFAGEPTWLRIHVTKGMKGLDATSFSKYKGGEREVIIQNNVRYLVVNAEKHKNFVDSNGTSWGTKNIIDVIALPHED